MNTTLAAGAVALTVLLAACGSTQYLINTTNGQMITAYGKPKVDKEAGIVTYRDADGKEVAMKLSDVKQVMER